MITVYSLLLGLPAIFAPVMSSEYFGKPDPNINELSLFNFIGGYQVVMGYLGYVAYRSTDKIARRGWLLSIACLCIFAILVYVYNLNIRQMLAHKTLAIDVTIWAIIALGSIYFWNQEK